MNGSSSRNRNALLAFVCAALVPFGLEPSSSQAGPIFKNIRGSYSITNNDPMGRSANDFHAKIAFGGLMVNNPAVFFTGGSTTDAPPVGPPAPSYFNAATKDNLNGWFFNYSAGDNVTPLPPGSTMIFNYTAKLFPGVKGLNPALAPYPDTYLTFTDAMGKVNRLRTGVASAGVFDVTNPNNPKQLALNLVNPGNDPLVLTNVQVWADSSLDLDAASFVPSTSNSTLYYSASSLTLGPNDAFSVPSFTVNDPFAPVIFEATVTDELDPSFTSFELLAEQNVATPEPASLTLLGTGTVGLLGFTWRRRKQFAVE